MPGTVWLAFLVLSMALLFEIIAPQKLTEGFQTLVPVLSKKQSYFSQFIPKRGDVGPNLEQGGYTQDKRYYSDYVDVQRFGVEQDFCRMVVPKGADPAETFFACALGGTKDISTVLFKTNTVAKGFKLSRDDYMRDIAKDGRAAYCRIIKGLDGTYQPLCRRAQDTGFSERDEVDPDPPEDVIKMLSFYEGCVFWLRMRDDLLDTVKNTQIQKGGAITIDETPRPYPVDGLRFDGAQQFLRLGDNSDLTLGTKVKLRSVRAWSMWVKMDAFQNNSHFFDFGDGAGKNNVFLGILGSGDPSIEGGAEIRPMLCGTGSTVPDGPSGAQKVQEVSPQELMRTTGANCNELVCPDEEVQARILPPSKITMPKAKGPSGKATLLYEVWSQRQRKVRILINSIIPLKRWTHIVVTAMNGDATRPDLGIYINGELSFVQPSGYLPQSSSTTNNYIGKSNWANDTSTYELRDELFAGNMFDFRAYVSNLPEKKVKDIYTWGKDLLAI